MQEERIELPGDGVGERNLNSALLRFLGKYNDSGNLRPPNRQDVENLNEAINTFYAGRNRNIRVVPRHLDLHRESAHFVTNVSFDGRLSLSFEPNGKHNPDSLIMLNRTNLHKPNDKRQGECRLWCIAAMVEIGKETNKRTIINKTESKELTKRITARFINLKQTMQDRSKFISLGENLDKKVDTLLRKGEQFITEKGMAFLMDPKGIQVQQNQSRSAPPSNIRTFMRGSSALSNAGRMVVGGRTRIGRHGTNINPQAVETLNSEQVNIQRSKSYNNIFDNLKQENMQKSAERMQRIDMPVENKEKQKRSHSF